VIGPLARLATAESDPRARPAFAAAVGEIRAPELRDALLALLAQPGAPRLRAAAWASLGAQRSPEDRARLLAARDETSRHGLVRAGAWRGLARLGDESLLDELERALAYGREPEESRVAVVGAYGRLARQASREARERAARALTDLLRDPKPHVRMQAARALSALAVPVDAAALEALKPLHPAQDAPGIDRLIARAKRGESDAVRGLRKELDELAERTRKLGERVDALEAEADT